MVNDAAEDNPGPIAEPERLTFKLPAGAWDCHFHVLGPYARFPLAPQRLFTPPEAPFDAYRALQEKLGLDHAVVVHTGAHGWDLSVTEAALVRAEGRWRAIALFAQPPAERELERLHGVGFRGVRLTVADGLADAGDFAAMAERIAPFGWHLQVLARLDQIPALAAVVRRLPVPCVFDHMGYSTSSLGVADPGFQTLLSLVRDDGCWAKLSGIDRVGAGSPGWASARPRFDALLQTCDRRLIWGSDWPHVRMPVAADDGRLLNTLADWLSDQRLLARVLVENPARLHEGEGADERTN